MIKETLDLLGRRAEDRITGYKGVISSCCFDLYGCVQVAITPPVNEKMEASAGMWFDVHRVRADMNSDKVMATPDFAKTASVPRDYTHGPADKPSFSSPPRL